MGTGESLPLKLSSILSWPPVTRRRQITGTSTWGHQRWGTYRHVSKADGAFHVCHWQLQSHDQMHRDGRQSSGWRHRNPSAWEKERERETLKVASGSAGGNSRLSLQVSGAGRVPTIYIVLCGVQRVHPSLRRAPAQSSVCLYQRPTLHEVTHWSVTGWWLVSIWNQNIIFGYEGGADGGVRFDLGLCCWTGGPACWHHYDLLGKNDLMSISWLNIDWDGACPQWTAVVLHLTSPLEIELNIFKSIQLLTPAVWALDDTSRTTQLEEVPDGSEDHSILLVNNSNITTWTLT